MTNRIRLKDNKESQNRLFFKSDAASKIKMKYPHLQDDTLQKKIALKKEFQFFYDSGAKKDIVEEDKDGKLCSFKDFELAPHQQFVKSFMSRDTPYNGLLLYHGMGSGKTCSAIGICEEYRLSQKYNIHFKKILVIASKNVQENFKTQLVDMENMNLVNGVWNLGGCVGNSILRELNLQELKHLSKKELHQKMMRFINKKYLFMGYEKLANVINDLVVPTSKTKTRQQLREFFQDRMIVVDEVHNVRTVDDNPKNKKVALAFKTLIKYVNYMKLLFLSGTPMYNDPTEIIFLLSLLNQNDRQSALKMSDIFDKQGHFIVGKNGEKIGENNLRMKANGYISYVRGENPFQFPFKLFPSDFSSSNSILQQSYPSKQFNTKAIRTPIQHLDVYCNILSEFQQGAYESILQARYDSLTDAEKEKFESSTSFTYYLLQEPIQALTLCVPSKTEEGEILTGKQALDEVVHYNNETKKYSYHSEDMRIFEYEKIGNYSAKIKTILDNVLNVEGIVLIYSQYLDAGLVPIALALEELGFTRAKQANLLETTSNTSPKRSTYAMITGDIQHSTHAQEELKILNQESNIHGELCKVVLISQAGSEGIDFKNLRQVHILEPWYNLNRVDQIIGRAIRNCSHRKLPLTKRNCQIFLHGSITSRDTECVDLMMYRKAEVKAQKIGLVQKVLKSVSVDCLLNASQMDFSTINQTLEIELADHQRISYELKDKPYSSICDYGECNHQCSLSLDETNQITADTFQLDHLERDKIIKEIKKLFLRGHVFRKKHIVNFIRNKKATDEQIDYALTYLIENETEYIMDKFMRKGHLINIKDLYLFQPIETDSYLSLEERSKPFQTRIKQLSIDVQVAPKEIKLAQTTQTVLDEIKSKYEKGSAVHSFDKTQEDFYLMYAQSVSQFETLVPELALTQEQKNKYLLHHILETIPMRKELGLIEYIFKNDLDEFEQRIKNYYKPFMYNEDTLFMVDITKKIMKSTKEEEKRTLYLKENTAHDKQKIWNKATSVEIHSLGTSSLESFLSDQISSSLFSVVGFMSHHPKSSQEPYGIKVKDPTTSNTGALVEQKTMQKIKQLVNQLLGRTLFQDKKHTQIAFSKYQLCMLVELLLRHFEETKKDGKHYFMNKLQYSLFV